MNKLIGEDKIEVNGVEYGLTPDFRALTGIESVCKKSVLNLLDEFNAGIAKMSDVINVLYECHYSYCKKHNQECLKKENFGQMILENGVVEYMIQAINLIVYSISGGKKKEINDSEEQSQ